MVTWSRYEVPRGLQKFLLGISVSSRFEHTYTHTMTVTLVWCGCGLPKAFISFLELYVDIQNVPPEAFIQANLAPDHEHVVQTTCFNKRGR